MSAEDKDLTILNHDQQLTADLKAGKVSAEEVARIWDLTSDLSAQAPINVRRAMIAIRAAETPEQKVHLAMQFMMSAATEIQAAMTRDESRFSLLVAHTNDIVRTLQNVNPLAVKLSTLQSQNEFLTAKVERLESVIEAIAKTVGVKAITIDDALPLAANTREEMATEAIIEEPYDARIGAFFDSPPEQGPLHEWRCPTVGCGYVYKAGKEPATEDGYRCYEHGTRLIRTDVPCNT